MLDDGTTLVRNAGVFENGMIWCIVPPTASLNGRAIGAGSGLPVTWLGATNGTSCSAHTVIGPAEAERFEDLGGQDLADVLPVAAETISRISGPQVTP